MGLGLLSGGMRIARPEIRRGADGEVRSISFSVPGEPVGKGRPRFTRTGHPYTPGKTESYESLVRLAYGGSGIIFPKGVPVRVKITACFGIPKSAAKKRRAMMIAGDIAPTKKPDFDNIQKIICDALNGFAYHDDSQIVKADIEKVYSTTPHVEVNVEAWKNAELRNQAEKERRTRELLSDIARFDTEAIEAITTSVQEIIETLVQKKLDALRAYDEKAAVKCQAPHEFAERESGRKC